jgi:soluble lytic murein transglycosylase-like protein
LIATQALEESLKKQRESVERQREAINRQRRPGIDNPSTLIVRSVDPPSVHGQADCTPLGQDQLGELVAGEAQKQSLDPSLLWAVIRQESGFKPCAISSKGARGLMQLMPATARDLHVADIFDPQQNIHAGAAYLRQLLERYKGDLRLALAGYNAGPGRADQSAGIPFPLETQNYVASILAELEFAQSDFNRAPYRLVAAPTDEKSRLDPSSYKTNVESSVPQR